MKREPNDVLSAFLDGETVEDLELAEALSSPGGREALVDFVLLRGAVAEAGDRPSAAFYARMDSVLGAPAKRRRWRALSAAAAVLALVALGLWTLRPGRPDADVPALAPALPDTPTASRTLYFERGVDWKGQG